MRGQWGFVVLGAVAALGAAGCASSSAGSGPAKPAGKAGSTAAKPGTAAGAPKPGTTAGAPKPGTAAGAPKPGGASAAPTSSAPSSGKPADTKPAESKPAGTKPAESKTPASKTSEPKPAEKSAVAKAAETKPPASKAPPAGAGESVAGGGFWASWDDFTKRTGAKLQESRFLGFRLRPKASEELDYTDNVYYQDAGEKIVADRDPDGDHLAAGDGNLAHPGLGQPKGKVADVVNVFTIGADLDMQLNLSLVPIIGKGQDTVHFFGASLTSVEYLRHADSPDALNWSLRLDAPALLNDLLGRLKKIDAARNSFYVRLEGDYNRITDPLDVAKLQVESAPPTFRNVGERVSFARKEWFLKGTLGWQGAVFDAKVQYRHYRMDLVDISLQSADHNEYTGYTELGYRVHRSDHRVYGFYEYTAYMFDIRGYPEPTNPSDEDTKALRNFAKIRTGLGWEGPVASKKIKGGAEVYYLATNVFHAGKYWLAPVNIDIHTGVGRPGLVPPQVIVDPFRDRAMVAGKGNLSYRPFVTKGTQLSVEYERNIEFSVVAQDKIVDKGSITFTHPINERLTGEVGYNVSMENVTHREKRLYNELGIGVRYKLAAYTEAFLRYTIRHMRSRREPVNAFADPINEPYLVKADGDFTANIIALGISVAF